MVHAATGAHNEKDQEKSGPAGDLERGATMTKAALENPAVQSKVKNALVDGGLKLRERTNTPGTRQALVQKLLNAMTPEAQGEFIDNTKTWAHKAKEGALNQLSAGLRPMWKAAAPSILPEDWVALETFQEDEVLAYIGIGAVEVDEAVASKVDGELKNRVKMLKVMAFACTLIPELGTALAEIIGGVAHLAEAPASFLEKVLPEVREAVRNGGLVQDTLVAERTEIQDATNPLLAANGPMPGADEESAAA